MQFLETSGLQIGGHMAVAMVIRESPAIIIAVLIASRMRQGENVRKRSIFRESFTEGANLLLLASLVTAAVVWYP